MALVVTHMILTYTALLKIHYNALVLHYCIVKILNKILWKKKRTLKNRSFFAFFK